MPEEFRNNINTILRDHEGYTGDGNGGNGALPVGDRSTARKPIVKRDLREALLAYEAVINVAEGWADKAEAAVASLPGAVYGTRAEAEAANVPAPAVIIWVQHDGIWCLFERSATAWLTTGGGDTWGPAEGYPTFVQHAGVTTNETKALALAAFDAMSTADRAAHQAAVELAYLNAVGDLWLNGWIEVIDEVTPGNLCHPRIAGGIAGESLAAGFYVTSRVNMAAEAIAIGGATGADSYAPTIPEMSIAFDQTAAEAAGQAAYDAAIAADPVDIVGAVFASDTAVAANLINYPRPFAGKGSFGVVGTMRVTGMAQPATWAGPAFGGSGNPDNVGGWEIQTLQLSGVGNNLLAENGFHFFKIGRVDDWVFDLGPRLQDYRNRDVTAGVKREAMYFGRMDSLLADHLSIFGGGQIVLDKGEGASITDQIGAVQLDGDYSSLTHRTGRTQISRLYGTENVATPSEGNKVLMEDGYLEVASGSLVGDADKLIEVTGGYMKYSGIVRNTNINGSHAHVSAGTLVLEGCHFVLENAPWNVGPIRQSGTGQLIIKDCTAEIRGVGPIDVWQIVKFENPNAGCEMDSAPRRRDDMVAAIAGDNQHKFHVKGSRVYELDGQRYLGNITATAIPDMPGLLPVDPTLLHFGAVGDCTGVGLGTDDSAAINAALAWLMAADWRVLNDAHGGKYRWRVSVGLVALSAPGVIGNRLTMNFPITPDAGVSPVLRVQGCRDGSFIARAWEGGADVDYRTADPVGGTEFFRIGGCRRCAVEVHTTDYIGRAVRTEANNSPYKNSFFHMEIYSSDIATADVGAAPVGQMIYAQGTTAWGTLVFGNGAWEKYGSVFDSVVDINIPTVEVSTKTPDAPFTFDNCGSIDIGTFNTGDETGLANLLLLTNGCRRAKIGKFFAVNGRVALRVEDTTAGEYAIKIDHAEILDSSVAAMQLHNVYGADINLASDADLVAVEVSGASRDVNINLQSTDTGREAVIVSDTATNISFTGVSRDASVETANGYASAKVTTLGQVFFDDFDTRGSNPSDSFDLVAGNNVVIQGGRYESGTFKGSILAKEIVGARGLTTQRSGTATILSGQTFVDISHGLIGTPAVVSLTGRGAEDAGVFLGADPTSATIRASVDAAVTADRTIYWTAAMPQTFGL